MSYVVASTEFGLPNSLVKGIPPNTPVKYNRKCGDNIGIFLLGTLVGGAIGSNLNQIAARANATGHIDKTVFQYEANRLRKALLDIQEVVISPERRNDNG